MSIVNFTEPAEFDLILTDNNISHELMNPDASKNTIDGIVDVVEKLCMFPEEYQLVNDSVLGRLRFRMTWYGNYNIFYIYNEFEDVVHIIRILYDKQDWETILRT